MAVTQLAWHPAMADDSSISYAARQPDKPLAVRLGDGIILRPYYLTDLDEATFSESRPGGQAAGLNLRREQLGGELQMRQGISAGMVWDFGSSPGGRGRLLEGQVSYSGLHPLIISVGILKPQFSTESVQNGADIELMERPAVVNAARNLAASSGRQAIQILGNGRRWLTAVSATAGLTGSSGSGNQRAIVGRALVLPIDTGQLVGEIGASGQYVWHPGGTTEGGRSVVFASTAELAVDDVAPSVTTRRLATNSAGVAGAEASMSWRRILLQGEYYAMDVSRGNNRGDLNFDGWYVQSTYTLFGSPRRWNSTNGVWVPTSGTGEFNPRRGHWGTLQTTIRFSTLNLNAGDVRGGRQDTYTVGLSYHPVLSVRLMVEYLHAIVLESSTPRDTNAVGGRFQLQF